MKDSLDGFLTALIDLTQKLADALKADDLNNAGLILEDRQKLIARFPGKPDGGYSAGQRLLIEKFRKSDAEAARAADELKSEIKEKMRRSKKLNNGLLEYYKSSKNLESGQIMDRKR